MKIAKDLTGQRFSRWVVLKRAANRMYTGGTEPYWLCRCDCGNERAVRGFNLKRGMSKSCGCLLEELRPGLARTHGESHRSPLYNIWAGMKQRCLNPASQHYARYGGRGIQVCARWMSYENFRDDMGERPAGATLDRIDNDGDYSPGNCRWSDRSMQANNRSSSRVLTSCGRAMTFAAWQKQLGVTEKTLRYYTKRYGATEAIARLRTYTGRKKVTHCPRGHGYTLENTRIYKGRRFCKECDRAKNRRRRAVARMAT